MPTSNARIGHVNHMEAATSVVATTENPNYPVANLYDWLPTDYFRPTGTGTTNITVQFAAPVSADYFAFFNQNLYGLGGTIKLQWWNGSSYVDCFAAISPADNTPRMVSFTGQTSDRWRIVVTCSSIFSLACVSFGPQLALEYGMYLGWTEPMFADDSKMSTSVSDGGNFLGRSVIANGIATDIQIQGASDAWMRANWPGLKAAIKKRAFFFTPDIVNHPLESVFCWVEDAVPKPVHTNYGFMGVSIPIKGMIE